MSSIHYSLEDYFPIPTTFIFNIYFFFSFISAFLRYVLNILMSIYCIGNVAVRKFMMYVRVHCKYSVFVNEFSIVHFLLSLYNYSQRTYFPRVNVGVTQTDCAISSEIPPKSCIKLFLSKGDGIIKSKTFFQIEMRKYIYISII